MKKITLSLLPVVAMAFFGLNEANAQWAQQSAPTTGKMEALYFVNATTGFTSSQTKMYKTTNGGTTWTAMGNYPARDIWFVDTTTGYGSSYAGATNGTMKKTTDGGATWSAITPPNSSAYLGVFATSATTAFFINTEDKVIKTTNAGVSVTSTTLTLPNSGSDSLTDIYFKDSTTGFICSDSGILFKTTNAGVTWTNVADLDVGLRCIVFVNTNVGYIGASNGKVFKTTNGGIDWVEKSLGTNDTSRAIRFYDENNGLSVSYSGKIFRTSDGGETWTEEVSGTTSHLTNVFYLDANTAMVVGEDGTMLKNASLLSTDTAVKADMFSFYPNPVSNVSELVINNIDSYDNLELEVFNVNGQLVRKDRLKSSPYYFEKNDLKPGVYFMKVTENAKPLQTLELLVK
jgi:photosystem II stability/assembly factor-like uncharacterized protein